jgi:Tol biopolymer transport system component
VLLLASGYWLGTRNGRQAGASQLTRFAVSPPAGFALEGAASRQAFALSPDGSRIAFTAMDAGGALSVFVRELSALEPKLIPDTAGAHTLFWAPDSRSLYLTSQGKLRRTSVDGGGMDVLGDTPAFLLSGLWLRPDRLMLSTNRSSFLVSPSAGALEQTKTVHRWPQLLPDGETFLHMEWDTQARRHRARAGRINEPGKELVLADSRVLYTASDQTPGQGYLLYIRSGNLLAHPFDPKLLQVTAEPIPVASRINSFFPTGAADFSVSSRGAIAYQSFVARSQLVWVDRQGRQMGTVGPDKVAVKSGRLSPDGRRLAASIYDVERGGQDIWTFDLESGAGRRLSLEPGVSDAPVWSPDSKQLALLSASGGRWPEVHVRGLGANDTGQPLMPGEFQMPTDWSSDGRFIVFSTTGASRFPNESQGDVWVTEFTNQRKTTPLLNSAFHEANAAFSPDGKWLAFTSNESGRTELYLQAFEPASPPRVVGERLLVSRAGVLALRWRRDGKELFYLGFDGRVNAVPVKLSAKPQFGSATPLFRIGTDARAAVHSLVGFDVSADGQRFVIPVVTAGEAPTLVVVQNWEAMLPRKR